MKSIERVHLWLDTVKNQRSLEKYYCLYSCLAGILCSVDGTGTGVVHVLCVAEIFDMRSRGTLIVCEFFFSHA